MLMLDDVGDPIPRRNFFSVAFYFRQFVVHSDSPELLGLQHTAANRDALELYTYAHRSSVRYLPGSGDLSGILTNVQLILHAPTHSYKPSRLKPRLNWER